MRVRARVARSAAGLTGALAMTATLSGCLTVHGESAIVPAVSQAEARRALDRYVEVSNRAYTDLDPALNDTIENGPLGAIDHAALFAASELNPDGNEDYQPLEVADVTFHIPQQAGWPKFFMAETGTNRGEERWLLVFTRNGVDERWMATYLAILEADSVPEFATDEDGHLADIPLDQPADASVAPGQLGTAYAGTLTEEGELAGDGYLQTGEGPFAPGPHTSGLLRQRDEENSAPEYEMQYRDWAAEEPENAPVAMRTEDGDALVFFASHHSDRQLVAPGRTPAVDPLVEELMLGTAQTSVTRTWVAMQTALVPQAGGGVELLGRSSGVVSAVGE